MTTRQSTGPLLSPPLTMELARSLRLSKRKDCTKTPSWSSQQTTGEAGDKAILVCGDPHSAQIWSFELASERSKGGSVRGRRERSWVGAQSS